MEAQGYLNEGKKLYGRGCYTESEQAFLSALKLDAGIADAIYGLGLIRYSLGDYTGAESWFRETVKKEQRHAGAAYYLGDLAERSGDRAKAIAQYSLLLSYDPAHPMGRSRLLALLQEAPSLSSGPIAGEPPKALRPQPPSSRLWAGSVVGKVIGINRRFEGYGGTPGLVSVVDLRVQSYGDHEGQDRQYSVSLKGRKLSGELPIMGDWVEVEPRRDKMGGLRPLKIRNMGTEEIVHVPRGWRVR